MSAICDLPAPLKSPLAATPSPRWAADRAMRTGASGVAVGDADWTATVGDGSWLTGVCAPQAAASTETIRLPTTARRSSNVPCTIAHLARVVPAIGERCA